ncbi:hypothetical protein PS838_00385 [Pseudomonas fluorescens]|nr:hypothetical protein PS838_00385 [Pseudomonas fluorescens]
MHDLEIIYMQVAGFEGGPKAMNLLEVFPKSVSSL